MAEEPKVIRKRIRSISSTKKITRTMEMVATAKLRTAQRRVTSSGPYLEQLQGLMREIGASGVDVGRWPHFEHPRREEAKIPSPLGTGSTYQRKGCALGDGR